MMFLILNIVFYSIIILNNTVKSDIVTIGGIFDCDEDQKLAFQTAVEIISKDSTFSLEINQLSEIIEPDHPFETITKVCFLVQSGAVAIFGPTTQKNIDGAQAVCDRKEIPHIITKWNGTPQRSSTIINIYPDPKTLARAYADIILAWNWEKFVILYEDEDSFTRLTSFMEFAEQYDMYFVVRQLDVYGTGEYRVIMSEIRETDFFHIVIDCQTSHLEEVLHQAQQTGLITDKYSLFITNLDLYTKDVFNYKFSEVNMHGLRLVDSESEKFKLISDILYPSEGDDSRESELSKLKTDVALLVDAVNIFAKTFNSSKFKIPEDLTCQTSDRWNHGISVVNFMKTNTYRGLTGDIKFNNEGFRTDFKLDVLELRETGMEKVGEWNSMIAPSLVITRPKQSEIVEDEGSLRNRTFVVSTVLTEPYAMLKESSETMEGNEQYEGYAIDLFDKLGEVEGFKYKLYVRPDFDNGGINKKGEWTGMIADVLTHVADFAIADLTVTSERETAVDFTKPFMNLGIAILFQEATKEPPKFFSFADPFALDTWFGLLTMAVIVSLSLYVLGRLSPDEWDNPFPCHEEPEYMLNQFHLKNSFWFMIGSIMQQGTELEPRGTTIRMVAGFWWFFVLIIIASYTANLAAFLTVQNPAPLFNTLEELVNNADRLGITYGAKANGATYKFFKNNIQNPLYKQVFEYMTENPQYMQPDNNLGMELAIKEKYAFFMETTSIDYATQRHCTLQKYGTTMDNNKGYAIAMRKNSPYRNKLNLAILKLGQEGVLDDLKKKWWEEMRGGGQCEDDTAGGSTATPLYLVHVAGVFYVTVFGTAVAYILGVVEWLVMVNRVKKRTQTTFKQAFISELKFFFTFKNSKSIEGLSTQPNSKSRSNSKSKSNSQELHEKTKSKTNSQELRGKSKSKTNSQELHKKPTGTHSRESNTRASRDGLNETNV